MIKKVFELSKKQTIALDEIEKNNIEELLYGGSKGGGKSVFLCYFSYLWCKKIIDYLDLKKTQYPLPVGFLGRKQGTDFAKTTLETWKKFIPAELYTIREQAKEIVIEDTVKIMFGGMDDEENIKKFNSAEFVFIAIDQSEELARPDIGTLRGTLFRFSKKLPNEFYKILLSANPADCWLKDDFQPENAGLRPANRAFVQSLPSDNEFIDTKKYIAQLREAYKYSPELVSAYIDGSWSVLSGFNNLMRRTDIDSAIARKLPIPPSHKRLVVADVARFGDDETIIYSIDTNEIKQYKYLSHKSTMETAGYIVSMAEEFRAGLIAIDVIGIGAGVVDRVRELTDIEVLEINSSEKPRETNREKYLNKRSEMYCEFAKMLTDGGIALPDDYELKEQLSTIKYEIRNGKIKIEDKGEIKKRIGKSPDRADACVMGFYALEDCPYNNDIYNTDNQFQYQSRLQGY